MTKPPERNLLKIIFTNFVNSFKPRQYRGNLMGSDHYGNKFFEIPPDPSVGRRKSSRWFEPVNKEDFDQEMPAEWDAWLRGRRPEPPTEEEVLRNQAIIQMKQSNAAKLDLKFAKHRDAAETPQHVTGARSFPTYKEYEYTPGTPHPDADKKS